MNCTMHPCASCLSPTVRKLLTASPTGSAERTAAFYPDYQNTVEVEYDRVANDAARTVEHIRESYKIYAGPAYIGSDGTDLQTGGWFRAEVLKCAPKYKDRLYLVNNILENNPRGGRAVWNNPAGGALQWAARPKWASLTPPGRCAGT